MIYLYSEPIFEYEASGVQKKECDEGYCFSPQILKELNTEESAEKYKEERSAQKKKELDSIKSGQTTEITVNIDEVNCVAIIMEIAQADLKCLMRSIPTTELNENNVTTIIYNTLIALNFIHSTNIIHRDLKPNNLLIDQFS